MRRYEFDQFEFPNPSTEERLIVTLEEKSKFKSVDRFLSRCDDGLRLASAFEKEALQPLATFPGGGTISTHLRSFAGISANELTGAHCARLSHEHDEEEVILETPSLFVLYQWSTSA